MFTTIRQKQDQPTSQTSSAKGFFFQPKLAINQPNDMYEQEADNMADKVMRMKAPLLSPQKGEETFFKSQANSLSFGEGRGEV